MDDQQDINAPVDNNEPPAKPLAWVEVTQKPEFRTLQPEQQEMARQQYFTDVVAPQVPDQYHDAAKQQFDSQTGLSSAVGKRTLSQTSFKADEGDQGKAATDLIPDWLTSAAKPIADKINPDSLIGQGIKQMAVSPPSAAQIGETARAPGDVLTGELTPDNPKFQEQGRNLGLMAAFGAQSPAHDLPENSGMNMPIKSDQVKNFLQDTTGTLPQGTTLPIKYKNPISADDALATAKTLYAQADKAGGVGGGQTVTNSWLDKIKAEIPKEGPAVINARGGPSKTAQLIENLEKNRGQMISYKSLDELDKFLGNEAHQAFGARDNLTGANIAKINDLLLQTVKEAPEGTLPGAQFGEQARQAFMGQLKLRQLEHIKQFADNTKNPATSIQAQLRQLVKRETGRKGTAWTTDELAAADKAAKTGHLTDLLQSVGNRLAMFTGHGIVGKAAQFAVSKTARAAADNIQYGKAANVANVISNKLPAPYDVNGLIPRIQKGETLDAPEIPQE